MSSDISSQPARSRIGVLVADDEPSIRQMLEVGLRSGGFLVWAATDGEEALDLCRQHRDEISVALLDVQMPGLDGPELLDALRTLHPDLTCCFMTGDPGSYTLQDLLDRGATRVFSKPFSLAEVARVLRQLAGQTERRGNLRLAVPPTPVRIGGQQARLCNRSDGGLGLWSPQPAVVGSLVGFRAEAEGDREYTVEVRYCQPEGDGWTIGCRFVG